MGATFQGLDIAKSGMMAYNASMQTAAHNLANVGTKGYSRQTVKTAAQTRHVSSIRVEGSGVYVQGIVREHNDYYDVKYCKANATYYKYNTHTYFLNDVQKVLYAKDEKQAGITTSFDEFCKRLTGTSTDAGSETRRKEIVSYAETFISSVQETATNLKALQEEANEKIKTTVEQINAIAEKIASLTKQINTLEAYRNPAHDLRDQRNVLIDELSQYCNVEVKEKEPADGVGMNQYYVYVDGAILVDTQEVNKMQVTEMDTTKSINDISGLYQVSWTDGTPFYPYSATLGGELQALFQVRDGNNATTLKGKGDTLTNDADGNLVLTMKNANINDVNLLNIPAQDGELTINNFTYAYDHFDVKVEEDGSFTYQFTLKNNISAKQATILNNAVTSGYEVTVGDSVDYKGIPYYMAQLNEFVRTYAQEFNDVHKGGYDDYGNAGVDFFNATVAATGDNYIFTSKVDGKDRSFSSLAAPDANGSYTGSYYYMTAMNFCVSDAVSRDPKLVACNAESLPGKSENLNLKKLSDLKDDSEMFLHGAPDSFLQSLTADVGVDGQKAASLEKSQQNIRDAVDIQRQSISGVDEDEETEGLLTFQQMLFNQYKVLSVMNEVLDKLINQTAV